MKNEIRDIGLGIKEKLTEEFGLNEEVADELIEDYGFEVVNIIEEKPYLLAHYEIDFEAVKRIVGDKSCNISDGQRDINVVAAATIYVIETHTRFEGHTFTYKCELEEKLNGLHEKISKEELQMVLELLEADGEIVRERDYKGHECIYLSRLHKAEVQLAIVIGRYARKNKCSKDEKENNDKVKEFTSSHIDSSFELNNNQINAICTALTNRITIISGIAGTGKSTVIKNIAEGFKYISPSPSPKIYIVSYTGKSANELSKKTGIECTTIHRFLGIGITGKDRIDSIEADVLIIDECGLIGTELMNLLICSIRENPNIRIVMVGDPLQLQSIEPGCVLKQLLKSGEISVVELTEVVRQNGVINDNVQKIIKGIGINDKKSGVWFKKNEFEFIEANSKEIQREVIKKIDRLLKSGVDINNVQVMSPFRKNTNGVEELNIAIANRFNNISEREIYKFGILDSIIAGKTFCKKDVFNGQRGIIKKIETKLNKIQLIEVDFSGKVVIFKKNEIEQIEMELSYVSSIHKMQGSESQVTIIVVDEKHKRMLSRELLYVAVTRGIDTVIIIGSKEAFNEGVNRVSKERHSLLAERVIKTSNAG